MREVHQIYFSPTLDIGDVVRLDVFINAERQYKSNCFNGAGKSHGRDYVQTEAIMIKQHIRKDFPVMEKDHIKEDSKANNDVSRALLLE